MAESASRITSAGVRWAEAARELSLPRAVLVTLLASRLMLTVVGLLSLALLPQDTFHAFPHDFPYDASSNPLVNAWSRWDGYWYLRIASQGYDYVPHGESAVAFWPLYPTVLAAVGTVLGVGGTDALAVIGIVVSNLALLVVVSLFVLLVRLDFDEGIAARAASFLLIFPTSFFLSAVYAESLFLALAIGSLYAARTDRWWLAGAVGGGAALTRPHGVLLVIPLVIEYLAQRGVTRRALRPEILALGLVPAGVAAYLVYLGLRFGNPFAALDAQAGGWGRALTVPWQAFVDFFTGEIHLHGGGDNSLLDLVSTVAFLLLAVASWRLLRLSYAVFLNLFLLGAVSSGTLSSLIRVEATLFPAFIVLAVIADRRPWVGRAYVIVSTALAAILMARFAQWYWVA